MSRPRYHAAASLGLAGAVVLATRRWQNALPILVAGILVDVDHLFDLTATFWEGDLEHPQHVYLPLHSWELVFGLLWRGSAVAEKLAGGLAVHLAMDQRNPSIRHP